MDDWGARLEELTKKLSDEIDVLPSDGRDSEIKIKIEKSRGAFAGRDLIFIQQRGEPCNQCRADQQQHTQRRQSFQRLALALFVVGATFVAAFTQFERDVAMVLWLAGIALLAAGAALFSNSYRAFN